MDGFASYLSDWPLKLIIMTEPGRALISKAGWLQTHAINISKQTLNTGTRSAFLALVTHHGLNEANKIPFEWHTWHPSEKTAPCVLYGATCGNSDIVLGLDVDGNEKIIYLPLALASGDPLWIHGHAAYEPAYCTSSNGVPPPKVVYNDSHQGISHFSNDGIPRQLDLHSHRIVF